MGTAEITTNGVIIIRSHIITYGDAADPIITERIREEIETMWNEPAGNVYYRNKLFTIRFEIRGTYSPNIEPEEILGNTDPCNNYFRIEEFAIDNISFVDGLGCNTGYFKLENLYPGSTTAAHEYGHTLGLNHPHDLDLRGKGMPGIMYPRGTLVDSPFQYNPAANSGDNTNGGTMHPKYRKVQHLDIAQLKLDHLDYRNGKSIIGEFSSIWHPNHTTFL